MDLPELALEAVAYGVGLRLRVVPGARRDAVLGPYGTALRVAVRAAPEKGRANEAVTRVVAVALAVPTGDVELIAGSASRDKVIRVRGLTVDEVRRRLGAAIAGSLP